MVSSIVPGAPGAGFVNSDIRLGSNAPAALKREDAARSGDRVDVSNSLTALRNSARDALTQVHQALAIGHDAHATLVRAQALARTDERGDAQAQLDELLTGYQARLEAQIAKGARLAAGEDVSVQAEPNSAPVAIAGVDLRLGKGVISLTAEARADDPSLALTAQRSLEALQGAMGRLLEAARALEAHQGFLGAAQGAGGVRHDLDADGARLLALQARQGLEAAGSAAIANVEPQAVLSLFRA